MADTPLLAPRDLHPALCGAPAVYVTGEDRLRLTSLNSLTGVTLTIVGRMLTLDGLVVPFQYVQAPNTDRTAKSSDFQLGDGWLLNVAVYASAAAPQLGQTFVMLRLMRGVIGATLELATIAQGYVTAQQRLAWPGSPIVTTLQFPGAIRSITGTDPAAGAEISETVPTGARWRLLAFAATLVASGAAGNRQPTLTIDDGTTTYLEVPQKATAAAGVTAPFSWGAGLPIETSVLAGRPLAGLPIDHRLPAGHRLKTITAAIDVADDWGAPQYVVEEWIEGA